MTATTTMLLQSALLCCKNERKSKRRYPRRYRPFGILESLRLPTTLHTLPSLLRHSRLSGSARCVRKSSSLEASLDFNPARPVRPGSPLLSSAHPLYSNRIQFKHFRTYHEQHSSILHRDAEPWTGSHQQSIRRRRSADSSTFALASTRPDPCADPCSCGQSASTGSAHCA